MSIIKGLHKEIALGAVLVLFMATYQPAQAQRKAKPSSQLNYLQRLTPGDGYMVAGELWDTIKPMNTEEGNGVEDPLANDDYLHWITIGPDGGNWHDPVGFWPGGWELTDHWRDGRRLIFPVYEADGWAGYTAGNLVRDADRTTDSTYMFAYYSPNLPGAEDPNRNYRGLKGSSTPSGARFTDETRSHMVYEAGWPTTAGIDFQIRAHQYTSNEQNINDFVTLEITMTNTGVVDSDGDGTPEETDHAIDAVAALAWGLPTTAVRVRQTGVRNANLFGAGRTMGYYATPDEDGAPIDMLAWYANVPPNRTEGRTTPAAGETRMGVNDGRFLVGYTDVWNGWKWNSVKQGSYEDGLTASSPDKSTIFGTHSVGEGAQRGWYTSVHWQSSLSDIRNSAKSFRSATATWYEDYGKNSVSEEEADLSPNSAFFSGGTPGDVTSFVVGDATARPNGDFKYASEDISQEAAITQPVWEPALNPEANSGNFYGGVGYNLEYVFSQEMISGIGPYGLEVGESMTIVFTVAAGFRFDGLRDAVNASEWAFERGWDISADLPTPPAPDVSVESTTNGTALVRWTDVSAIDGDIDGYKIWRTAQFKRKEFLEEGFRVLDKYHHLHEPGADFSSFLDPVNPFFDAEGEFVAETQGVYQGNEWGTYELIAKIPAGEVSQFGDATGGYDFSFEDEAAITGFTYWYYVSSYKEGNFMGPQGAVPVGHIESSNFNRNGRNAPGALPGEIGLDSPWGGTYPFADRNADFPAAGTEQFQNIGYKFTVAPPLAAPQDVENLITVTPNPYKRTGLNDVRNDPASHSIDFLNTPESFTLTIIDVSGQIVFQTVIDGAVEGKYTWDMFSKDGVEVASGLYIFHLQHSGGESTGHFAILR